MLTDEYICKLVSYGNGQYEYEPTGQEIVRCKDCKWYSHFRSITGSLRPEGRCGYHTIYLAPDDYCSRARKNEVEE